MLLVSDIDSVKSNERYIFNKNVSKISEWMIDGNLFMISSNRTLLDLASN